MSVYQYHGDCAHNKYEGLFSQVETGLDTHFTASSVGLLAYFPLEWLSYNWYTLIKSLQPLFELPFIAVFWGRLQTLIYSKFWSCRGSETAICKAYFQSKKNGNSKDARLGQCKGCGRVSVLWSTRNPWNCLDMCAGVFSWKKNDFPGHLIGSGLLEVDDKSASGESVYNFAVTLFPGLHGFLGISK